jgi:DNA mismatch repair protein MutL
MPDFIRLLPDSVANQIAAGEVIQRPASALKELMENAIDAGASQIKIFIKDAGRTLIQVIDNGTGMNMTDARMCFERHATLRSGKQGTSLLSARLDSGGKHWPPLQQLPG